MAIKGVSRLQAAERLLETAKRRLGPNESDLASDRPLSRSRLDEMTDAQLVARVRITGMQHAFSPRFSRRRWRWRRADSQAGRALVDRLHYHAAENGGVCEKCGQMYATHHAVHGKGPAVRFTHFCDECDKQESSGWFFVAHMGRRPTG